MKVKFLGYVRYREKIDEPWFTVGKTYEVKKDWHDRLGLVWVISDNGDEIPMFKGEYEIVEQ